MAHITYRIDLTQRQQHRYRITLSVPRPEAETTLSLPVWIPGSYMVREFGRHLSGLSARQGQREVALTQLDKTTWRAECSGTAALELSYEAYAFDSSVRTAFLDDRRGFFNATSLCLRVHGREAQPHGLRITALPRDWQVATAMPAAPGARHAYLSANYDELIDHPFEMGAFWRGEFEVAGARHEFVVSGAWPGFDGERLLADAQRICAAQIAFWHGKRKPPFQHYVFLLNVVDEGHGGLEHRASTALIANRRDLPRPGQPSQSDGYVGLLGLISHEYFHTWNVKRLKPAEFTRLDPTRENYTELLWFFEGFTSYFDDLMLLRAGLIDAVRYLKLLAKAVNALRATPGRHVQSVAESSFDAWVKYYRSDENTPNSTVSYYTKGALIALLLDLRLRSTSGAKHSLDTLMRTLWQRCSGGALSEADVLAEVRAQGGAALADALGTWVHGRGDLPLEAALAAAGVAVEAEASSFTAALGLKLSEGAFTGVQIKSVLAGGVAEAAGLSAGDELLAVNGWRIRRLDDAAQWTESGQAFELLLARQQQMRSVVVQPRHDAHLGRQLKLTPQAQPTATAAGLRKAWLGC